MTIALNCEEYYVEGYLTILESSHQNFDCANAKIRKKIVKTSKYDGTSLTNSDINNQRRLTVKNNVDTF